MRRTVLQTSNIFELYNVYMQIPDILNDPHVMLEKYDS